jgi:hypothetical protein
MHQVSTNFRNAAFALTALVGLFPLLAAAQKSELRVLRNLEPIICYQKNGVEAYHVGTPDSFRKNASGRTKTANIVVEYINFPADNQAKNAFQFAVDIWETQLTSTVPIRIRAQWGPLDAGVLGQATWGAAFANFNGAQHQNVYYPVALAEKISGTELNAPTEPDIVATFNSNPNWYFGTDGNPGAKTDLVTVVLHEICHGLGFVDTYSSTNGQGSVGLNNVPFIYDIFVVNSGKESLFSTLSSPSAAMNAQLVSNNLFYNSKLATIGETLPRIFAPATFDAGSSIAHLNESTFSVPGDANNLMTPQIAAGESIHQPGSIALGILNDMGWLSTRIDHAPLKDSERKDGIGYPVKATIVSDNGFKNATVTLNYRTPASANYTAVTMSPSGVLNEFQANLPGVTVNTSYAYYITAEDNLSRVFRNPGLVQTQNKPPEQNFNVVNIGPDTEGPEIVHTPVDFIFDTDSELVIEASITDNIVLAQTTLEFQIDAGATQSVAMTKMAGTDTYRATIAIPAAVELGDLIKYRILARDGSSNSNQTTSPATNFYTVFVTGDVPAQNTYVNDFNTASFDFIGNSFSITTPANFENGAIHSEHPYQDGTGPNDESNYIYQLQVPIIISSSNHFIRFDEIVLVEPGENGSEFGDEDFFDFVVVEGSKDNGATWTPFQDGYDSRDNNSWLTRYNSNIVSNNSLATGIPTLYRERLIDMLTTSNFAPGDKVKIRFRLFADQAAHGWGWAIDNLSIQGSVTGVGYQPVETIEIFPNPASEEITIRIKMIDTAIDIFTIEGKKVRSMIAGESRFKVDVRDLPAGLYILKATHGRAVETRKFVKVSN